MPRLLAIPPLVLACLLAPVSASRGDAQVLVGRTVVGTYAEGAVVAVGDAVATTIGRAEMLFADGTLLHVDADTRVRWAAAGPLTLEHGRILLKSGMGGWLDVALPFAQVTLAPGGSYGFLVDASRARLLVSVTAGSADLRTSTAQAAIGPSQMVVLADVSSRIVVTAFEPPAWDAFARWSRARQSARILAAAQAGGEPAPGSSVITLGPGGHYAGGPVSAPAPAYPGGEVIWYGGGGVVGWPTWGYGGGRIGRDRRRDPYAPRYEPRYEPFPHGETRGPRGDGRGGPGRTFPTTGQEAPRELPPLTPPPPAPAPPRARGGAARLPSPGAPPPR